MLKENKIIKDIKKVLKKLAPDARVILYGSYARGEETENSDFDLLILLNKNKVTTKDEKEIKYPLYKIEFETGKIISPIVLSKSDWELKHKITPFYENVSKDGLILM